MPRCCAAMGILGGVSKMCHLVEDSLRHLRCRGMTSQSFSLAMPILTTLGVMTGRAAFLLHDVEEGGGVVRWQDGGI